MGNIATIWILQLTFYYTHFVHIPVQLAISLSSQQAILCFDVFQNELGYHCISPLNTSAHKLLTGVQYLFQPFCFSFEVKHAYNKSYKSSAYHLIYFDKYIHLWPIFPLRQNVTINPKSPSCPSPANCPSHQGSPPSPPDNHYLTVITGSFLPVPNLNRNRIIKYNHSFGIGGPWRILKSKGVQVPYMKWYSICIKPKPTFPQTLNHL